jgi:hypothetical protein
MKQWKLEFNMEKEDTCKKQWIFHMKQDNGVKVIESLEIAPARQGCPGHPKTIEALVRDMPVDNLDLEALHQTTCMRNKSCGMNLADCVSVMKEAAN